MATEASQILISAPAAADHRTKQFYAMTLDTSGNAAISGEDLNCDGFLQNKPNTGEAAAVAIFGVTKAKITDTITVGQLLEVGTDGSLVGINGGTAVAKALEAGATGNIITVLMLKSAAVFV